jgi:hypothetical protein
MSINFSFTRSARSVSAFFSMGTAVCIRYAPEFGGWFLDFFDGPRSGKDASLDVGYRSPLFFLIYQHRNCNVVLGKIRGRKTWWCTAEHIDGSQRSLQENPFNLGPGHGQK